MGEAKKIEVRPISRDDANRIVAAVHYSRTYVRNSSLHFGVFYRGKCGGAIQFGPSMDKRKIQHLVSGTAWNGFIELNRMAFSDWLPRNSESRALGYAFRFMRKTYPWIEWVVTYADGTQCGDGTIYRASGFLLVDVKRNRDLWVSPDGKRTMTRMSGAARAHTSTGGANMRDYAAAGWTVMPGHQIKYLRFLEPSARDRLTVPVLPFSEIDRLGARMYKGRRAGSIEGDAPESHSGEGGSTPTPALQSKRRRR